MEILKGGKEPATKDDLRNLQITMLAEFKLCMEELAMLSDILAKSGAAYSKQDAAIAVAKAMSAFQRQMNVACRQILHWENGEQDD